MAQGPQGTSGTGRQVGDVTAAGQHPSTPGNGASASHTPRRAVTGTGSRAAHSSLSAPTKQERLEETGPTTRALPVTDMWGHSVTEKPLWAQEWFPWPGPGVLGLELCPTKGRCLGTCCPCRPSSAGCGFS